MPRGRPVPDRLDLRMHDLQAATKPLQLAADGDGVSQLQALVLPAVKPNTVHLAGIVTETSPGRAPSPGQASPPARAAARVQDGDDQRHFLAEWRRGHRHDAAPIDVPARQTQEELAHGVYAQLAEGGGSAGADAS